MESGFVIRQMTENDLNQVKQIIDLSFPIFYRFFALHSLHEEGQVIVGEITGRIVGFVKLINFFIGGKKYGCILWIAVHPNFRRKGIAATITSAGVQRLKHDGSFAVFASTQRRNVGALSLLSHQGFRRISFHGLWRLFSWQAFKFYIDIWLAPGEIVFTHN